jgi:hypothetical protein
VAALTRTEWVLLAVVVLLVVLPDRAPAQPSASQPSGDDEQAPYRLLLLGDSLAVGLAQPLTQAFRAKGVHVTAEAKQSTTAGYWVDRARQLLRAARYDIVFASVGTNDCRAVDSIACADFGMQARRLRDVGRAYGTEVVFLVPSWLPDAWVRRIRGALFGFDAVCIETGFPDVNDDGIHPTVDGYRDWARQIVASWENL